MISLIKNLSKKILKNTVIEKIIKTQTEVNIIGKSDSENIVIIFHKLLKEEEIKKILDSDFVILSQNGIYYSIYFEKDEIYSRITFPATENHLKKFLPKKYKSENFEEYQRNIAENKEKLQTNWIRNIIENNMEEKMAENEKFAILPDSKWDMKNENFYYLLLTKDPEILTIREADLKFLKEAKIFICDFLAEKNIKYEDCLIYFHYKPSYYSFHLHIISLEREFNKSQMVARAILLDEAIDNLELDENFYKKRTLYFVD